jgi:ribonucleoside-triphosphate reductase
MNVNIRLDKNFTTQLNRLNDDYGTTIAALNGLSDEQLSLSDFIKHFISEETVADSSIDGNSNVRRKDVVTLLTEMPKPHRKLLGYNKIHYEYQKLYGFRAANDWLRREWIGELYLHDSDTSTFKSYCFAYDLKDLAEKGLYFLKDNFNAQPPKHLTVFVDFVKEFISFASNRTSGACGLPNLLVYMFYFWKKDVENDYLGIRSSGNEHKYAIQNIQRFIYAVNQPCVRDK